MIDAPRKLHFLALAAALALLLCTGAALADDDATDDAATVAPASTEPAPASLGALGFRLPATWAFDELDPIDVGGMTARLGVAASPDGRVRVTLALIDPFGLDPQSWSAEDLLDPMVLDLMATSGYFSKNMIVRRSACEIGDQEMPARLVIFPREGNDKRLIAGMACAWAQPTRWAFALVLTDSWYDRPLMLEQALDDADALVRSLHYD